MIRFFDHLDSTGALLAVALPGDCIDDCSAAGDVQESVRYWVRKLGFNAPEKGTREYLAATGAWDDAELSNHEANLERLLWLVCCDERERYLGDGPGGCTCDYVPPRGFPSRIPTWACDHCQAAYEDACEARADDIRDRRAEENEP